MKDTVIKIVLKKEAKVVQCKELLDWISRNENVKGIKLETIEQRKPERLRAFR